jgi:hypothetical protein
MLDIVCREIRLLRAVCYRPLYLSEVPQSLLYSSAYLKGNIIDVTHRILKPNNLTFQGQKRLRDRFIKLVNTWMILFFKKIGPITVEEICARNKSKCSDLFGSKIIDLLESIPECKKYITVNIESGGWCYIKGEYKLPIYGRELQLPRSTSGKRPLNVRQQANLHNRLFYLVKFLNRQVPDMFHRYKIRIEWELSGYYWDPNSDEVIVTHEGIDELTFKVDLKCRRELAPVEILVELHKEQSYESEPGAHAAQDSSPDLELKMEIESRSCRLHRRETIYKSLIRYGNKRSKFCQWLYLIKKLWLRLWLKMTKKYKLK